MSESPTPPKRYPLYFHRPTIGYPLPGGGPAGPGAQPSGGSWPTGPFGGGARPNGPFGSGSIGALGGGSWTPGPFGGGAWAIGPFGGGAWPGGPFGGGAWSNGPFGGGSCPNGPFCGSWPTGPFSWGQPAFFGGYGGGGPINGPFGGPIRPNNGCQVHPFCNARPGSSQPIGPSLVRVDDPEGSALVVGLGYHSEVPDNRDLQLGVKAQMPAWLRDHPKQANHIIKQIDPEAKRVNLLDRLQSAWPVEDQGQLSSCTAHAVIGQVEYLMRRDLQQGADLSRLFLYNTTRHLLGWPGDAGAYIRTTIQAMAVFGVPPEDFWPYAIENFDVAPDAFLYSYAASFKSLTYMRLDANAPTAGAGGASQSLLLLKRCLADGYPVAFGFPIYDSIVDNRPDIPVPTNEDRLIGGHAVLAVGYDDNHHPEGARKGGRGGAVLIRNSWGRYWGDAGYGWLPYEFFNQGLAVDAWVVFKQSWLDQQRFQ